MCLKCVAVVEIQTCIGKKERNCKLETFFQSGRGE